MSLFGSLSSSVSALKASGEKISSLSNNISNLNTVGFKSSSIDFSSLVTGGEGVGGGVTSLVRQNISQQGLIQSTGVGTDVAIQGQGFIVVEDTAQQVAYTRAGSFRQDNQGNLVNTAGFFLKAWPLDANGVLPGATDNKNTTSSQLLESLQRVNTTSISGQAFATTNVKLGLNLNADQKILPGAGDNITFPSTSANNGIGSDDIIVPNVVNIVPGTLLTVNPGLTAAFSYEYGGYDVSNDITTTNMYGSATTTATFTDDPTLDEGDGFTITTVASGTITFKYQQFSPSAVTGTFNSLSSLSAAIDISTGLTSRISGNKLYISSNNANEAITFANLAGNTGTGNMVTVLTLANVAIDADSNRYNTLDGLSALVNASAGISATVSSSANNAQLTVNNDNPLDTITFSDSLAGDELLTEFTLKVPASAIAAVYDTGTKDKTMASGKISSSFSRNIRLFDSLGVGHDFRINFLKSGNNTWQMEMFPANANEVVTSNIDSVVASGKIQFNGNGTLLSVDPNLTADIAVALSNDAQPLSFKLDFGTAGIIGTGKSNGLSQFAGPFTVKFAEQNGSASGELRTIEIDSEGFVTAQFTNGDSRKVFKIPLASFANPDGLRSEAGNVFTQSDGSGEFTLTEVGNSGVGEFAVSAVEQSDVELADQLTDMIVVQRSYQAATKVLTTVDELLDELNRL